jgi:hypothetical protein
MTTQPITRERIENLRSKIKVYADQLNLILLEGLAYKEKSYRLGNLEAVEREEAAMRRVIESLEEQMAEMENQYLEFRRRKREAIAKTLATIRPDLNRIQ